MSRAIHHVQPALLTICAESLQRKSSMQSFDIHCPRVLCHCLVYAASFVRNYHCPYRSAVSGPFSLGQGPADCPSAPMQADHPPWRANPLGQGTGAGPDA
jgi:hypothetical protein